MDGTTAGPTLRWVRALVLATVALLTGALFHVLGGGLLPGPAVLALLLAASTAATAPLLGAPASERRVVALLVVWQVLLHLALTATTGHHGGAGAAHGHAVPHGGDHLVVDLDLGGPHAVTALGHLVAAALVGMWLAAGERALWALLLLAAHPVLAAVGALRHAARGLRPVAASSPVPVPPAEPRPLLSRSQVRPAPRRGPPVAV